MRYRITPLILLALPCSTFARGVDCNDNGVPDATDIANMTSQDCNENGVPDECDLSTLCEVENIDITDTDLTQNGVRALTWWSEEERFLWSESSQQLYGVSSDGDLIELIGDMDHTAKGLAFVEADDGLDGVMGPVLYSVDRNSNLLREIDPETGDTEESVPLTTELGVIEKGNGLATHPVTGELYGALEFDPENGTDGGGGGPDRQLFVINPLNGDCTLVGDMGVAIAGLAFDSSGTLFGVSGDGASIPESLYEISIVDGSAQLICTLGNGSSGEALAYNPEDDLLYHASGCCGDFGPGDLGTDGDDDDDSDGVVFERIVEAEPPTSPDCNFDGIPDECQLVGNDCNENMIPDDCELRILYAVSRFSDQLMTVSEPGADTLETVSITLPSDPVTGCQGLAAHPDTGEVYALLLTEEDFDPLTDGSPVGQNPPTLAIIDPETGEATPIGSGPLENRFVSLAFDATGTLYTTDNDDDNPNGPLDGGGGPSRYFSLSLADGSATFIQFLLLDDGGNGLAFNPEDGLMYFTSGPFLTQFDPSGGAQTLIPTSGNSFYNIQAMTYAGSGFFWTGDDSEFGPLTSDGLYTEGPNVGYAIGGLAFSAMTVDSDGNGLPDECGTAANYCTTSPNSVGPGAIMGVVGSTSLAADDLVLICTGLPDDFYLFFVGTAPADIPFLNGTQCVINPCRLAFAGLTVGGTAAKAVPLASYALNGCPTPVVGDMRYFQCFYRDSLGANTSDAIAVFFVP